MLLLCIYNLVFVIYRHKRSMEEAGVNISRFYKVCPFKFQAMFTDEAQCEEYLTGSAYNQPSDFG